MPTVEEIAVKLQKLAETTHTNVIVDDFTLGGVTLSSLLNSQHPPYMALEDLLASTDLSTPSSPRGLQYTVAALLFQELTSSYYLVLPPGQSPQDLQPAELTNLLATYPPVPRQLSKLNARFGPVFNRALHPNPRRRFDSLDSMAASLWEVIPTDPSEDEKQLQAQLTADLQLLASGLDQFDAELAQFSEKLPAEELEQRYLPRLVELEDLQEKVATHLSALEQIQSSMVHPVAKARLSAQIEAARGYLEAYLNQYTGFMAAATELLQERRRIEADFARRREEEQRLAQAQLEQQQREEAALKQKQAEEEARKTRERLLQVEQLQQTRSNLTRIIDADLNELREDIETLPPEEQTASNLQQYYSERLDKVGQQLAVADGLLAEFQHLRDDNQYQAEKEHLGELYSDLALYLGHTRKEYLQLEEQANSLVNEREEVEFVSARTLQLLQEQQAEQARQEQAQRLDTERQQRQMAQDVQRREAEERESERLLAAARQAELTNQAISAAQVVRVAKAKRMPVTLYLFGGLATVIIAVVAFILITSTPDTKAGIAAQANQTATARSLASTTVLVPTVTLAPVFTPELTANPTATANPTGTPAPTSTPTASPSPSPSPTVQPTPGPKLAVLGVGTSRRGDTEKVEPADATSEFKVGDDVFGYINFGDGRPNLDQIEVTLLTNGLPQAPQTIAITKELGFLIFPLGKLGAAAYKLEVRYNGNLVANQPDFKVVAISPTATPTVPPALPTSTSAAQPTATTRVQVQQPTSTSKPVIVPTATSKPVPTTAPPAVPTTAKPVPTTAKSGVPTCSPGTC